jgi:hypothetical protein
MNTLDHLRQSTVVVADIGKLEAMIEKKLG